MNRWIIPILIKHSLAAYNIKYCPADTQVSPSKQFHLFDWLLLHHFFSTCHLPWPHFSFKTLFACSELDYIFSANLSNRMLIYVVLHSLTAFYYVSTSTRELLKNKPLTEKQNQYCVLGRFILNLFIMVVYYDDLFTLRTVYGCTITSSCSRFSDFNTGKIKYWQIFNTVVSPILVLGSLFRVTVLASYRYTSEAI